MNENVTNPNSVKAEDATADHVRTGLAQARRAGQAWAATPIAQRLAVIASCRHAIARDADRLAATNPRPLADTLSAEILPLAEAARFLIRSAAKVLAPRRLGPGPLWLTGVRQEIRREPRGVVLILAPGNYPLFLPGAQALQALAAGNAVAVKPAPGSSAPMLALAALLAEAGLPDDVFQILPEDAGPEALRAGYDYVVLTGSAVTGVAVARAAAETLTPSAMELSGVDAAFVLPGADLSIVAASLAYGLRLNAGATCIAPRRIFVPKAMEADLLSRLLAQLPPPAAIPAGIQTRLVQLTAEAERRGARIVARNPAVIAGAAPDLAILREDVFAPWVALVPVTDMEAALEAAALCPYALGASIFGPPAEAYALAARLDAGSVCVNDLIVPTADPRLPFGGRHRSGFGVTRGAEGLLEMTLVKTVSTRRFGPRPHLDAKLASNPAQLLSLIRILHGAGPTRLAALKSLVNRGSGRS